MKSIVNPLLSSSNKRQVTDKHLDDAYHNFMVCYGWIPKKEFDELDLSTFWELLSKVIEQKDKMENFRLVMLKFAGVKNPV